MPELALSAPPNVKLLSACCRALDDKKAVDLLVLELGEASTIADCFVIATGTSEPHLRALAGAVSSTLKEEDASVLGRETTAGSGWAVVDAYDVMVHLFTAEVRDFYNLEGLWRDARRWKWDDAAGELLPSGG